MILKYDKAEHWRVELIKDDDSQPTLSNPNSYSWVILLATKAWGSQARSTQAFVASKITQE